MTIRAGALRHSIRIEQQGVARGTMGGASTDWTVVVEPVSASIEPLAGRELFSAQQHHAEVTVRVRLRYREGVLPSMRVVHRSVAYSVLYVINPALKNAELQLLCSQGKVLS